MKMKMFRKLSCLALATLAFLSVNAAEDDGALLWMIGSDSTVNRFGTIYTIEEFNEATGFNHGQIDFVRIAAQPTVGGDAVYLYMCDGENPPGSDPITDTIMYLDFDAASEGEHYVNKYWATFAGLEGDLADYSFAIQLGNLGYNEVDDTYSWNIEAVSDNRTYAELQNFINHSVVAAPGYDAWNPGAYNIPEPSAGLMLLIGFGFLSLRRKELRK